METSVNNKCRAFTSLEQSKKLAEFLPLESADMWYHGRYSPWGGERRYDSEPSLFRSMTPNWDKPCWSLASLLSVLPTKLQIVLAINDFQGDRKEKYAIGSVEHDKYDCFADNPVDACYEMILKLHKLKML